MVGRMALHRFAAVTGPAIQNSVLNSPGGCTIICTTAKEADMEAITYSHTRQHLAEIMNKVADDRAPVLITRQAGSPVVMMSLQDYNALEETAYLMRSPKNAKRLMESIEQLAAQGGQQKELLPDAD
jgi:antitoxin YefM